MFFSATVISLSATELPQDRVWKVTLRNFLGTLPQSQFEIDEHEMTFPESYTKQSDEQVYRDWIVLGHLGREPVTAAFQADPKAFLLKSIETGDEIHVFPGPAALAWWIGFDFPGNPYANSEPGMRRALVIAIVDMLMLETAHVDPYTIKPDFMGANLGTWAYTFRVCGDRLPVEVQSAYREGMLHYLGLMERIAPRDGNTNMDMRELATLAELDHVFSDDEKMHRRLVNLARRILFGRADRGPSTSDPRRGTFHPAGYIGEADGPETSYNGISLFHLAEAAMISRGNPDWDAFMLEVIERMVRFKAYNTFPQPEGGYDGPSSWSTRTNDPYPHDQRDRPWRPYAEAMLTNEALFRIDPPPTRETMLADIQKGIARFNRKRRRPEKWKADIVPVWKEGHWPADLPYTRDHYVDGSFANFNKAAKEKSELFHPPFARAGDFNISFDDEFWMVKHGDWGFQVEAVPHMSRSYGKGGSGALAGGSLAAFWTKSTGTAILGRLPHKWNYVTWDKIESWTTHHLWGRTAQGSAFSSARQWHPRVHFDIKKEDPQVHVFGDLGPRRTVAVEDSLDAGHVNYRRTFTLRKEGLHIKSELLSRGEDVVAELWESLPIFLSNTRQKNAEDTKIEFRIGDTWSKAVTEMTDNVSAIRASRFGGAVVIEFDQPQRVGISEIVVTEYQKKDRYQMVKIDLMRTGGKPGAMPVKASAGYLIRSSIGQ